MGFDVEAMRGNSRNGRRAVCSDELFTVVQDLISITLEIASV